MGQDLSGKGSWGVHPGCVEIRTVSWRHPEQAVIFPLYTLGRWDPGSRNLREHFLAITRSDGLDPWDGRVDAVYVVPVGDGCPTELQTGVGQVVLALVHDGYTCSSMMRIADALENSCRNVQSIAIADTHRIEFAWALCLYRRCSKMSKVIRKDGLEGFMMVTYLL